MHMMKINQSAPLNLHNHQTMNKAATSVINITVETHLQVVSKLKTLRKSEKITAPQLKVNHSKNLTNIKE